MGATPWARGAVVQVRAAGGAVAHQSRAVAALLSLQELEVSRLASKGLSNREIGDRMHLSSRTVGSHLYWTFPKLGISARAELRDLDFG
ncbi:helix-turn-helix transcriptional regulator [Nonomuraea sp. NPDC049158]|uniref:response regulator transcription factor n=1 Tax=Nonomuraea sp. NPDC049158 TaxID=3155649 RepID=UPI0033F5C348